MARHYKAVDLSVAEEWAAWMARFSKPVAQVSKTIEVRYINDEGRVMRSYTVPNTIKFPTKVWDE